MHHLEGSHLAKNKELSFTQFDGAYWGFANNPSNNEQLDIEMMYQQTLMELSINRFKWENLPKEIDHRFLELALHQRGLVVFFQDNDLLAQRVGDKASTDRYFALTATGKGQINMYDNPTEFIAIGNQMMQRELTARECVPIWGNAMRIPQFRAIRIYAKKLAKIDRTIDITVEGLRYSRLITANSNNQRLSIQNIFRQVEEGAPGIFINPGFDPSQVQALDLGIHPDVLPKLMDTRNSMWNQAMGFLGINNANQDKRERLVASEVQANDEQVLAVRAANLNARQYAAEQINDMFGLDISVSFDQTAAMTIMPDGQGQYTEISLDDIQKEADSASIHNDAAASAGS